MQKKEKWKKKSTIIQKLQILKVQINRDILVGESRNKKGAFFSRTIIWINCAVSGSRDCWNTAVLDPNIVDMDISITGSRCSRNSEISGSRNFGIGLQILYCNYCELCAFSETSALRSIKICSTIPLLWLHRNLSKASKCCNIPLFCLPT